MANGSSQEYPSDLPQRPPKVSFKNPPPLPPRSDSFSKKQFPVSEIDSSVVIFLRFNIIDANKNKIT